MNPPCVGDQTTCGKQFNRTVACYQVPENFQFGQGWTTNPNVKAVSMSFCPDVATTPAYDSATGTPVTRDSSGKLTLTTVCGACNYASAVLPWNMNPCPCFAAGDYCNATSGTTGVCHSDGTTPCSTTDCPPQTPTPAAAAMAPMAPMMRKAQGLLPHPNPNYDHAISHSNHSNRGNYSGTACNYGARSNYGSYGDNTWYGYGQ